MFFAKGFLKNFTKFTGKQRAVGMVSEDFGNFLMVMVVVVRGGGVSENVSHHCQQMRRNVRIKLAKGLLKIVKKKKKFE